MSNHIDILNMTEQEQLVYCLRLLANKIERVGAEKISFWIDRKPVPIDPVQDTRGQWWACFKAGKKMDIWVTWNYIEDENE